MGTKDFGFCDDQWSWGGSARLVFADLKQVVWASAGTGGFHASRLKFVDPLTELAPHERPLLLRVEG